MSISITTFDSLTATSRPCYLCNRVFPSLPYCASFGLIVQLSSIFEWPPALGNPGGILTAKEHCATSRSGCEKSWFGAERAQAERVGNRKKDLRDTVDITCFYTNPQTHGVYIVLYLEIRKGKCVFLISGVDLALHAIRVHTWQVM